jgi:hypothetical protein
MGKRPRPFIIIGSTYIALMVCKENFKIGEGKWMLSYLGNHGSTDISVQSLAFV